jgi:hypothetical protein
LLHPNYFYDSIFQIPYEKLYAQGIRGLVFDIDNTLGMYEEKRPAMKVAALLKRLQGMGFQVGLLSNNGAKRVNAFNEFLKLPVASMALKPSTAALRRVIGEMQTAPDATALIGDQLLTDVWCGKRAGMMTILVKPISDKDIFTIKIKRWVERRLLRDYKSVSL